MNKEYKFTIDLIKKAGEELKKKYFSDLEVSFKEGDVKDIVTNMDIEINDFIIKEIKRKYSEHNIYSEESDEKIISSSEYLWTIDPIDGTSNFSRHIPHFAICIGLLKNGVPIVGAVYNPITNELFSFEKGKGAFLNDKKIKVSDIAELKKSHILLHIGRKEGSREWGIRLQNELLMKAKKTVNLASSSLDICFVASNRLEATIYGTLSTMDISCAVGILEEAGGELVTFISEKEKFSENPQKIVAVCNNKIKEELLKMF